MKRFLISCLASSVLAGCGGGNPNNNATKQNGAAEPQSAQPKQAVDVPQLKVSDKEFFDGKSKLPKSVDFSEPVEAMSFQRLRFMKAYVYATHGFWLKDFDLNNFFTNRTEWYYNACFSRLEKEHLDDSYWEKWSDNYETLLAKETLSPEEQAFVDKIDERLAALNGQKYTYVAGVKLTNPALCTNIYQFPTLYDQDGKLWKMLAANNIAFQTTNYEQLFNVYEDNEYHCVPNFVTTDLFLQAFHSYFEYALKLSENSVFTDILKELCSKMISPSLYSDAATGKDKERADFSRALFAVAYKLLDPSANPVVPEAYASVASEEYNNIMAAADCPSPMLKTEVNFPYSIFKPRGHYTRNEKSQRYFRAMMWVQLACFDNSEEDDVAKAVAIAYFYNKAGDMSRFEKMYDLVAYFMGEPDNVSIVWIAELLRDRYASKPLADVTTGSDFAEIRSEISKKFATCNRIKPKQAVTDPDKINFMPQRYEPDNEVIANMYDEKPNSDRAYPSGLDVFDAFGIKAAANIIDSTDKSAKKWGDFAKTRKEMSKFAGFKDWNLTSYNKWMQVLTAMQNKQKDYPGFMQTPAWECKNLNSALASWAQLKHDAILYAEQAFGAECGGGDEFPEPIPAGFVEPNVKFWETMLEAINNVSDGVNKLMKDNKFENLTVELKSSVDRCLQISKMELAHKPIGIEEAFFIRSIGSSMEWFALSSLDPESEYLDSWSQVKGPDRSVAVVADVFTRNILQCEKQGILYEATGAPNTIFVLVEYNGVVYLSSGATFSYYEFVRPMGDRLTDEQWQKMLEDKKAPAQPTWFAPLLLDEKIEASETFQFSSGC